MDLRIEQHTGARGDLRPLFELAEDSAQELDRYINDGRILVAVATAAAGNPCFYQHDGFRMRSIERDAFTVATGHDGQVIDGFELRDRVWLDRPAGG